MPAIPLPPPATDVDGLISPTAGDARSYVGWRLDAYLYEWQTTRGVERWAAFWLAGQTMVQTPFLLFLYAAFFSSSRRRYYMTDEGSAIVGVVVRRGTWRIVDHAVASPGRGTGEPLWLRLLPALWEAADREQVVVVTRAASSALAKQYAETAPGLKVGRRALPRGVALRREPIAPEAGSEGAAEAESAEATPTDAATTEATPTDAATAEAKTAKTDSEAD